LYSAHTIACDIGFVVAIMRSDTSAGKRGRISFVLIGCERSGKYRAYKKDLVGTMKNTRKCGCPFKLQVKQVLGGEGWMVNLICETHNHALAKSLSGYPYVGRLTEDEKIILGDMTKSMVKPKKYSFHFEGPQCQQLYNNEASLECKICISFFYKRQ